ncbi:sugar phosphate isomerase/epimerase family protein [Paenibacillus sp. GCM10012307]|uniref:Sugar phosphate isomerase/epimerase n=1 Tax=Paenibacillus roseus TaxID=2798579 RepID=A0A934J8R3_9BACL|nr:sugar phosphate isomerase/epimerase [Paenibacillus roseus]
MIKGLTRAGTGHGETAEQFIRNAASYGFGAVDLGGDELESWAQEAGLETAKGLLKELGVVVGSIHLPVDWRSDEETFRSGLADLARHAQWAAKFGVDACCTYVLPATDYKSAHFTALATRRLRICADILDGFGVRLGLEFVGPHHLRTNWANPFLWTMEETLDWIQAIGRANVGLLLDAYHWHTTGGTVEDLLNLKPSQIVHVHINDAKPVPVEEALDNDRLYPGEGVINLAAFVRSLAQIGYQGAVSQEILTSGPSGQTNEELYIRSAAGFAKVFQAAEVE